MRVRESLIRMRREKKLRDEKKQGSSEQERVLKKVMETEVEG